MELELPVAIVLAGILVGMAALFFVLELRRWRAIKLDPSVGDADRADAWRRCRRRIQMSIMLVVLAAAIVVGVAVISHRRNPSWFVFHWVGVVILLGWIVLLSVADLIAVRHQARRQLDAIAKQRRELEAKLREVRRASNGERS